MTDNKFDPNSWAAVDKAAAVCRQLVEQHRDITAGYDNWLRLGFALADGLGEQGRQLYHDLSALNADYDAKECDKQYDNCMKSHGNGVTIATFFKMAKDAGVDIKNTLKNQNVKSINNSVPSVPECHQYKKSDKYYNSLIINNRVINKHAWHAWHALDK